MAAEIESTKGIGAENVNNVTAAVQQKTAAENTADGNGVGEEQNYIVVLDNGDTYVKANRKIINSETRSEQRKEITKFFNTLLMNKPSLDIQTLEGDVLTITKAQTANKARDDYKTDSSRRVKLSDNEFLVKLHATSHIDELAEVSLSPNKSPKQDSKSHSFAKDGFTYRTAYFEDFDGQYYRVTISVGHNDNIATIYNIRKTEGSVPPSAKIIAVVGSKALDGTLPDNSIPNPEENVNRNIETDADKQYHIDIDEAADVEYKEGMPFGNKKLKYDKNKTFFEQISEVLENEFPSGMQIYMKETPKKLSEVGLDGKLPLITTQSEISLF